MSLFNSCATKFAGVVGYESGKYTHALDIRRVMTYHRKVISKNDASHSLGHFVISRDLESPAINIL